jgi:hypothetical protein
VNPESKIALGSHDPSSEVSTDAQMQVASTLSPAVLLSAGTEGQFLTGLGAHLWGLNMGPSCKG